MRPILAALVILLALAGSARAQVSDIFVENTTPVEEVAADSDVTFTMTVTNGGPDTSDIVGLDNPLPAGMTFVSLNQDSGPAFNCDTPNVGANGSVSCTIPALLSGQAAVFTAVYHVDPAAPNDTFFVSIATSNTATDPSNENDSATATVHTPFSPQADLGVEIHSQSGTNADTDVPFTITVTNAGPGAPTNAQLDDTFPGDSTFVSLTQNSGPTLTCSSGSGSMSCDLDALGAGESAVLTLVLHIPAATADGTTYFNQVTVSSDHDPNSENDASITGVCVQGDSCAAGACNNNVAVVCPAPDQCHSQGTCDSVTGVCAANPPLTGTDCDDGNACTDADSCDDGTCLGTPLTGTGCDDGDECTHLDSCQAGTCKGADPVICPAADQCHRQGQCQPATGLCDPNRALSGIDCDDGNLCTEVDTCNVGVCEGTPLVCAPAPGPCLIAGKCDLATGVCRAPTPRANGASCDDNNACTPASSCQQGACVGTNPVVCPAAGPCEVQGVCSPFSGLCAPNGAKPNGDLCSDGSACTTGDSCQAGVCQSGGPADCDDHDGCTSDSCDALLGCVHEGSCDAGVIDAPLPLPDAPAPPPDAPLPPDAAPPAIDAPVAAIDAALPGADAAVAADARPAADAAVTAADARPADARAIDAAMTVTKVEGSGCGCRAAGGGDAPPAGWLLLVGLVAIARGSWGRAARDRRAARRRRS